RHGDFAPVDHRQLWDGRFPGHKSAARIGEAGGISLSPALSGTDGFYFHALRRAA
ncbi:MAG: MFS transporter, partial [Mesorhizobium sp.]